MTFLSDFRLVNPMLALGPVGSAYAASAAMHPAEMIALSPDVYVGCRVSDPMAAGGGGPFRERPPLLPLPPNARDQFSKVDWRRLMTDSGARSLAESFLRDPARDFRGTFREHFIGFFGDLFRTPSRDLSVDDLRAVLEFDPRPEGPAGRLSLGVQSGIEHEDSTLEIERELGHRVAHIWEIGMDREECETALRVLQPLLHAPVFSQYRQSVMEMDRLYDRVAEMDRRLQSAQPGSELNQLTVQRNSLVREIEEHRRFQARLAQTFPPLRK